jgi:hypothetical protein
MFSRGQNPTSRLNLAVESVGYLNGSTGYLRLSVWRTARYCLQALGHGQPKSEVDGTVPILLTMVPFRTM